MQNIREDRGLSKKTNVYNANIASVLLMAALFAVCPAYAGGQTWIVIAQGQALSLDDATAKVRNNTNGRVVSAEEQFIKERRIYRIKILMPTSQVKVFIVDAVNGTLKEE